MDNENTFSVISEDPFSLRDGVKSEGELSELRKRSKSGKKLESFHRKQNDVRGLLCKSHRSTWLMLLLHSSSTIF
jgi:hypothetical protein